MSLDRGSGIARALQSGGPGSEAIALPLASQTIRDSLTAVAALGEDPATGTVVAVLQIALPPLINGGREYLQQLTEYFKRLAPALAHGAVALVPDRDLKIWLENRVDVDDVAPAYHEVRRALAYVDDLSAGGDRATFAAERIRASLHLGLNLLEGSSPTDLELPELEFRPDGKMLRAGEVVGEDMKAAAIAKAIQTLDRMRGRVDEHTVSRTTFEVDLLATIDLAIQQLGGQQLLDDLAGAGEPPISLELAEARADAVLDYLAAVDTERQRRRESALGHIRNALQILTTGVLGRLRDGDVGHAVRRDADAVTSRLERAVTELTSGGFAP